MRYLTRTRLLIAGAFVLIAIAAVNLPGLGSDQDSAWVEAMIGDLIITVDVEGTLVSTDSSMLTPPTGARRIFDFKISMMAPEGEEVSAGTPVLGFDTSDLERQLRDRQTRAAQAAKNLEKLDRDLEQKRLQSELRLAEAGGAAAERRAANASHRGDEDYNWFTVALFPADQLTIMPYNRVVTDLGGHSAKQVLDQLSRVGEVTETDRFHPDRPHVVGIYLDGHWYRLEIEAALVDATDPVRSLDVALLQSHMLEPIFGIGDPQTDPRLDFVGGIGAVAVTLRASIAFAMRRARFASAVTHELRTPLTTFRMYSEMLADGMVSDPDQRQTYLETLRDESGRLSMIVENVLAYARLEEGRSPARSVATTAAKVLDEVVPALRRRAETADLELRLECDVDETTPMRVDVEAVGQILFNLVDNACKYAADASERIVHLDVRSRDGQLVLGVRDHGPGVPGAVATTIFDAFDRGTRNDGDPTPGVGLGLALARGLARDMGGDLQLIRPATNGEATGAHFELALPLR